MQNQQWVPSRSLDSNQEPVGKSKTGVRLKPAAYPTGGVLYTTSLEGGRTESVGEAAALRRKGDLGKT
jgi:hypothetical protein